MGFAVLNGKQTGEVPEDTVYPGCFSQIFIVEDAMLEQIFSIPREHANNNRRIGHPLSHLASHNCDQIKGLRRHFAQVDEDGTGVLTREQFCDMLAGVGIYLTAHEQERVKERYVVICWPRGHYLFQLPSLIVIIVVSVAALSPPQKFQNMVAYNIPALHRAVRNALAPGYLKINTHCSSG